MKKKKIIAFVCLGLGILCGIVGLYKYMEEKRYVRQRKRSDSPMRNTANICGL